MYRKMMLLKLVFVLLLAALAAPTAAETDSAASLRPLGSLLRPDGTLDLEAGWSGSLDATGWLMHTGPSGEPRFVAAQHTPASPALDSEAWDDRFGYPGIHFLPVYAVAISGQHVFVGGDFFDFGGDSFAANNIARWDGRRWHALGTGLNGPVRAMVVEGADLYVGGEFTAAGGASAGGIARWNGSAWSAVGSGVGIAGGSNYPTAVFALAFYNDALYIGGDFSSVDGVAVNAIARWNGAAWLPLGQGVTHTDLDYGLVYALAAADTGLYVGGQFDTAGAIAASAIARWNGSSWAALGSGLAAAQIYDYPQVLAITVHGSQLYAGGWFAYAGGQAANSIARWDGAAWHALGSGIQFLSDYDPLQPGKVNAITVSGSTLYAGGNFNRAGGAVALNLAQWNGSAWAETGGGAGVEDDYQDPVWALATTGDGSLIVGGKFDMAGDMYLNNIATWDGARWQAWGQGLVYENSSLAAYAVAVNGAGQVFIGGDFTHAGGLPAQKIAMWDGQSWSALGGGVNGWDVQALVVDGPNVYVGGQFSQVGAISANNIARWNQTSKTWSALGSGINGPVYALAFSEGILYAGGNFSAAGSVLAKNLAWWDGSQWHPFGQRGRLADVLSEAVYALVVDGEYVVLGGSFWEIVVEGVEYRANSIAMWNKADDAWYLLGANNKGVAFSGGNAGYVYALEIIGPDVYAGGRFVQAGDSSANGVARWRSQTNTWEALGDSVGGGSGYEEVRALQAIGSDLYVGGDFTAAGNTTANYIARWETTSASWSALGSGMGTFSSGYVTLGVYALSALGTDLYVAGDFATAGGQPAADFAHWGAPPPPSAGTLITPAAGGVLTTEDGFSLTFPPGAVSENLFVSYQGLYAPTHPLTAGKQAIRSFTLEARTATGQLVTTFQEPYTMQITYTDQALTAVQIREESLNLLYWNGSLWSPMFPCAGCVLNTAANQLTIVADHFTEFALAGQQERAYLPVVVR